MSATDNLVTITISQQTQQVSRRAFGWAMVIGVHSNFADRLKWYDQSDWSTEILADGFVSTDDIYDAVERYFAQTPCPTKIAVGRWNGVETLATALSACLAADGDWYGLLLASKTAQDVKDAMDWAESNKRLFLFSSWDPNIVDTTKAADSASLAYYLQANAYKYSACLFTRDSLYPEAAWMGRCLPKDPGTVNWAHKTLAGVVVNVLSSTQRTNAHAKYASTYETIGGVNVTEEGWTGSGDFLDIRQALDWLEATLQEDIFSLLANTDKVPYTDQGIKAVEGVVRSVLKKATDAGVLAPYDTAQGDYYNFPKASEASTANKTARILSCPKCFQRRLAGALNHVTVVGNVTV